MMTIERAVRTFVRRERPDLRRFAAEFSRGKLSARQWADFWGPRYPMMAQISQSLPNAQLLSVLPPSALQLPDLQAFANEIRGIQEVVRWDLYHFRAYPTTGAAQLTFFDQTEGTATNGRADTNMVVAGQLPGNQMHIQTSINVTPIPAVADAWAAAAGKAVAFGQWYPVLFDRCWLEFKISQKEVMVGGPIALYPEGAGLGSTVFGAATVVTNPSFPGNGTPDNLAMFHLDPPTGILPTRPFSVTLNWRALNIVTTAGRIGVNLDGWLIRAVL
jgi:hypothetical protein